MLPREWHETTHSLIYSSTVFAVGIKALTGVDSQCDVVMVSVAVIAYAPLMVVSAIQCGLRWFVRFGDWMAWLLSEPVKCGDKAGRYECCLPKGHKGNCQCVIRWDGRCAD